MQEVDTRTNKSSFLWLSIIFSVLFPMLLGFVLSKYISDWRWIHYPFHSMVESVGSLSALTIATLTILMVNDNNLPRYYIWVSCALISMGILDGSHAVLHAGVPFVWLHSIATMIGGLTFAAIWSPESWLTAKRQKSLITSVISISILISLFSIIFPDLLPEMVFKGEFSALAKILNISGGLGFLIGSSYFIYHHIKNKNTNPNDQRKNEDVVFANHCLLFGIAGILFESSIIWDAGWWWWHVLRLIAYLVVLVYFFTLFKQQQDLLQSNKIKLSNINKHLEQRVYERTKELEKANQAKSDFLSSMSHELRTPLNAILGFGQLLDLDEKLQSDHKRSVNEILFAGHHLLELINEILDLSRIEEGKLKVNITNINISRIIADSITTLMPIADQNNIQLINNKSDENDDYIVRVDSLRFRQVIINLLSNAIKYNHHDGKVFVNINVINNNKIRISIKDTGPGITKDKQKKLFIPFERLGYEGKTVEGAGIGLIFSKKLTELMDGNIGMHSIPGQGCTFYIEFPYNIK